MDSSFTDSAGIYHQYWQQSDEARSPKGTVIVVHGLAEHSGRYTPLAAALNAEGYAVAALDLPGHGRSAGVPGHISQFADYHAPLLELTAALRRQQPDSALYILGHSMGGLIVGHMLLQHQRHYDGVVLSGAAIASPQQPSHWQLRLIALLSRVAPKLGLLKLDASAVSRDPEVVERYFADPLVYRGKLSARFIQSMFQAMTATVAGAAVIDRPVLIMHGGDDAITDPAGSELLYQSVSSSDKTLKNYAGLFHEIFNEPEAPVVFADVVQWLDRQQSAVPADKKCG